MKKIYVIPEMFTEEFISNEYISACYQGGTTFDAACGSYKSGLAHLNCKKNTFTVNTNQGKITSIEVIENNTKIVNNKGEAHYCENSHTLTWSVNGFSHSASYTITPASNHS